MTTQSIHVEATPGGTNMVGGPTHKTPVIVYNGDTFSIGSRVRLSDGTPATPDNCELRFCVADNRFNDPLLTLTWSDGIEAREGHPGWIRITIPADETARMRRGGYIYSLLVIQNESVRFTVFEGAMLIDYSPTSPLRRPGYIQA